MSAKLNDIYICKDCKTIFKVMPYNKVVTSTSYELGFVPIKITDKHDQCICPLRFGHVSKLIYWKLIEFKHKKLVNLLF